MAMPLYWQVASYLKTTFFLYWLNDKYNTSARAVMIQQNGTYIYTYFYYPFMWSPKSTEKYRKSHSNHEYLKLRNHLFTCISRCYEQEKQCQYLISENLYKDTDSTLHWSWNCMFIIWTFLLNWFMIWTLSYLQDRSCSLQMKKKPPQN